MKSIMEEGSSISKAIEKGWIKAGSPKEFSVKIYEDAEKNFFGMTSKPAKIGIFFDEGRERRYDHEQNKPYSQKQNPPQKQHQQKQAGQQQAKPKHAQESQKQSPGYKIPLEVQAPKQKPVAKISQSQEQIKQAKEANLRPIVNQVISEPQKPLWTQDMITAATDWLNNMLSHTEYSNVKFSINSDKYYLKVNFASPICQDLTKERQLFAGIALLLMQSIKKKFDNPFKGYKVILMRNEINS